MVSIGLIPAHAGKTCGGDGLGVDLGGSSPLTRGKQDRRGAWRLVIEAHPRSRGENLEVPDRSISTSGSSPLTRGKHFLTCTFIAQIGQILESLELCASFESYSLSDAYATDAPRDRVRSIGLAPPSSRAAS